MSSKLIQQRSADINRITGGLVAPSLDVPGEFDDVSDKRLRSIESLLLQLVKIAENELLEISALRTGMIDAGLCTEMNLRDVELPFAMQQ